MKIKKQTKKPEVVETPAATTENAVVKADERKPEKKGDSVLADLAEQLKCRPTQLLSLLKSTVFRNCRKDEEFQMACMVAREYRLNPILKEIYAFPSQNGVVPIVSVDGWNRIMNSHPMYDGIEFEYAGDIERDKDGDYVDGHGTLSCTARIHRKDRANPVCVTEFYEECWRDTDPWNGLPRRMLRWKALIQCARVAFGFAGIYDFDEGNDILAHENRRVTKDGNIVDVPVVDVGLSRDGNVEGVDSPQNELVYENEPDPTEDEEPVVKVVETAPTPEPDSEPETEDGADPETDAADEETEGTPDAETDDDFPW